MPTPHFDMAALAQDITQRTQEILGPRLRKIILFGSYARGDFTPDSDVDIMVLAALDGLEASLAEDLQDEMAIVSSRVSIAHDITVCVMLRGENIFYDRTKMLPFYNNVKTEGVELYGAA